MVQLTGETENSFLMQRS